MPSLRTPRAPIRPCRPTPRRCLRQRQLRVFTRGRCRCRRRALAAWDHRSMALFLVLERGMLMGTGTASDMHAHRVSRRFLPRQAFSPPIPSARLIARRRCRPSRRATSLGGMNILRRIMGMAIVTAAHTSRTCMITAMRTDTAVNMRGIAIICAGCSCTLWP